MIDLPQNPAAPTPVPPPETVVPISAPAHAGSNKKLFIGLLLVLVVLAVVAVVGFALLSQTQQAQPEQATTREIENPFEAEAVSNPFTEEATYANPFEATPAGTEEYQNPFEALR